MSVESPEDNTDTVKNIVDLNVDNKSSPAGENKENKSAGVKSKEGLVK